MNDHLPKTHLLVCRDSEIVHMYSDELQGLDEISSGLSIVRASHVEPASDGSWMADLRPCGGPTLSGFKTRRAALDAEVAWIEENILKDGDGAERQRLLAAIDDRDDLDGSFRYEGLSTERLREVVGEQHGT